MAEAQKVAAPLTLRLKRTLPFSRERVFAAFSQQEQMNQWMCRDAKNHDIRYTKFDFRVGGGFELEIRTPNGHRYAMHNTYVEIVKPEKIKFTWGHEHFGPDGKQLDDMLGRNFGNFRISRPPGLDRNPTDPRIAAERETGRGSPARMDRLPG